MKNKNFLRPVVATILILLVPLVGQWPWSLFDFVIMGGLIMGTGLTIEFALSKVKNSNQRILVALGILAVFFVIWAQLAVGLIDKGFMGLDCLANRGLSQLVQCSNDVRTERY